MIPISEKAEEALEHAKEVFHDYRGTDEDIERCLWSAVGDLTLVVKLLKKKEGKDEA